MVLVVLLACMVPMDLLVLVAFGIYGTRRVFQLTLMMLWFCGCGPLATPEFQIVPMAPMALMVSTELIAPLLFFALRR